MAEEIIFRVGVDTGDSAKEIDGITDSVGGLNDAIQTEFTSLRKSIKESSAEVEKLSKKYGENSDEADEARKTLAKLTLSYDELAKSNVDLGATFEDVYNEVQPLSTRLGEMEDRMYELALAGKQNTKEFIDLQEEAARFRQTIINVDQAVDNLAMKGKNLQTALQLGETIVAGYGAIQGITALVGSENEELIETLTKLQAVQTTLASIEQIRLATEKNSLLSIKANTIAQRLYTLAVGETTGAMKLLRLAMIATGIGALIAGIVLLIQNWDKLTGVISSTKIAQEGLNDTLEDYKTGATDAVKETNQVKVAFDLAKQGVISKEEALQTYNETLGDSFGKASDLNEAERLYAEKTDAYIKATALRAQANALLTKAAEEQANALTAQFDDQTSFLDQQVAAVKLQFGFIQSANETLIESQKKGVVEAKKTSQQRASIFEQEATRLLKEAETTETANGIKSESEQKLAEQRQKLADEAAKKRQEAAQKAREEEQKRAEELIRLEREITDATIAAIADRETRERMALAEKHRRELEDLRKQYGERQELIMALEERQAIEQRNFDRTQDELSQQIVEDAKAKKAADDAAQVESTKNLQQTLLDIMKKSADDQLAIDEAIFQSRASFASNVANVIGQLAGLAKEGTATQKALALTEIAINTAVGFVQGLRIAQQSAAASGPAAALVFPIFYAQQLAAVLGAAKQAKNILGAGASVSAPSVPSSGGSGFSGGVQQQGSLTENGTTNTQTLQQPNNVMVVLPVDSLKKVQSQSQMAESVATFG